MTVYTFQLGLGLGGCAPARAPSNLAVSLLSLAAFGFLLLGRLLGVSLGALLVGLFPRLQNTSSGSKRGKKYSGKVKRGDTFAQLRQSIIDPLWI